MPDGYTERGFADYTSLTDGYGNAVTIRESSAASIEEDDGITGPWVWIFIEGEAHLREDPRPIVGIPHGVAKASSSAHLNIDEARKIRDGLDEHIKRMERECDWIEPEGGDAHDETRPQAEASASTRPSAPAAGATINRAC